MSIDRVLASFVVDGKTYYRLLLLNGTMIVKPKPTVRAMINGDLAIEHFDPHTPIDDARGEPTSVQSGPGKGDVLLVTIDGCLAACVVIDVVADKNGRPLYTTRYDDGMLVQDYLFVPWAYLSVALMPSETSLQTVWGKRRMPDAVAQETRLAATVAPRAPAAPVAPLDDPEAEQKMRDEILLQKTYAMFLFAAIF